MSVSKLESVPNEILIDLLEKYVNGVDIFVALAVKLNKRFDTLINQCQRFHFNFESIQKYNFRTCIGILPDYRDRIESLTLSERDTPGQIHAFLSFFPTFDQFKRLRRLCLNFDCNTVEKNLLNTALRSLLETNIQTLSIKGRNVEARYQSDNVILSVLTLLTLRRFCVAMDLAAQKWNFPILIALSIEHLTIEGDGCTLNHLMIIFKYATRLTYLNARVVNNFLNSFDDVTNGAHGVQQFSKLHTLLLQFIENDPSPKALEVLVPFLRLLHNLRHIEIIDQYGGFLNGCTWQKLLETSLPLLNCFVLKSGVLFIEEYYTISDLASFQTPFWIEKENFNVYIITYRYVDDNIILDYHSIASKYCLERHLENDARTHSCWTIPQRCVSDSTVLMNNITALYIRDQSFDFPTQYYLNNVAHLTVCYLNSSLISWMTTNVNLLNLTKLLIPNAEVETDKINCLLARAKNISSLQIHFSRLFGEYFTLMDKYNSIRRLDISAATHPLKQDDIFVLARFFPFIEHLKINTIDLENVPFLNVCLPKLCSLTFKVISSNHLSFEHDVGEQWDYKFRSKTKFLFNRTNSWITIWVDQDTFQESFWQHHRSIYVQCNREISSTSHKSKYICCGKPTCILI